MDYALFEKKPIQVLRITKEINKCPMCGSRAVVQCSTKGGGNGYIANWYAVTCESCGISTKSFESRIEQDESGNVQVITYGVDQAIAAWNRRADG